MSNKAPLAAHRIDLATRAAVLAPYLVRLRNQGESNRSIARILNLMGLLSPSGTPWNHGAVGRMMTILEDEYTGVPLMDEPLPSSWPICWEPSALRLAA